MESLTKKITEWLIANKAVDVEDRELYEYAIYSMLITVSPLFLVLIIGMLMGTLVEGVFLIIPFMCIRKYSGGYHAKSFSTCFVTSCGLLVLCMYLAAYIEYGVWSSVLAVISVIGLSIWSPIDSDNRRLDADENTRYKKIAVWTSVLFLFAHLLLVILGQRTWALGISVGLMLSAGLQLPCVVQSFQNKK